jgi:salicylate hydroxylase
MPLRRLLASLLVVSAFCRALAPGPACIDVAIVGGGPCGLAAALALRKASPTCSIAVFERDAELKPVGSSVVISPAGWAALRCIDAPVSQRLKKLSAPVEFLRIMPLDGNAGEAAAPGLTRVALRLLTAVNTVLRFLKLPRLGFARSNLWHEVRSELAARVAEVCGAGTLRQDHALEALAEAPNGGGFDLSFAHASRANGSGGGGALSTPVRAKVVLACDGSRSACRELAPREPNAAAVLVDEGKSVWRGIAPSVDLAGRGTFLRDTAARNGGRLAVTFPAGGKAGGASWTVIRPSAKADGRAADSDDARRRLLAALPPRGDGTYGPLEDLWRCVEAAPFVLEHRLQVRVFGPGAPSFCSNTNGLAFLGDAAHPVRPTGQGIALAFEDAWQLGALVQAAPDGGVVDADVLRCYETARLSRVRQVSEKVRAMADAYYADTSAASKPPAAEKETKIPLLRPTPL